MIFGETRIQPLLYQDDVGAPCESSFSCEYHVGAMASILPVDLIFTSKYKVVARIIIVLSCVQLFLFIGIGNSQV